MHACVILNPADNVGIATRALTAGERPVPGGDAVLAEAIPAGHKFSLRPIPRGEPIRKYDTPIGRAAQDIPAGAWVHTHNVETTLSGEEAYTYAPSPRHAGVPGGAAVPVFQGFRRPGGQAGIRNEVWIVPTVGCVNHLAEAIARDAAADLPPGVDAVVPFPHPHGCSQMGEDHETTRRILANLARHPNAGGVLFVGLGCENNTMPSFRARVESIPDRCPNLRFLVAQEVGDEFAEGRRLLRELLAAAPAERAAVPVSALRVGMKCGGSDGLSGVTANPLLGAFSDWLVDRGGGTILTEVPEMFGAEQSLLNRAVDGEVFRRGAEMVNSFKRYFARYGQVVYENPSPGNKEGGITTLEDKSVGCTQKGGTRGVVDVIPYGGTAARPGVTLMAGPGNDIVSVTGLSAAGAQLVLFTTGRGTPLGGPSPVVKVSSNSGLAARKKGWIDFDAGPVAEGAPVASLLPAFVETVIAIASGRKTRSEENGFRDFSIFKDGVTL